MERDGKIHGLRSDPNDNTFGTYIYPWAKKFSKQQPSHILEQDFKISIKKIHVSCSEMSSSEMFWSKMSSKTSFSESSSSEPSSSEMSSTEISTSEYPPQKILLRNILLRYAYQDFSIFRRRLPITGNYVIFLCNGCPQSCQIYPKYWIFIAKIS